MKEGVFFSELLCIIRKLYLVYIYYFKFKVILNAHVKIKGQTSRGRGFLFAANVYPRLYILFRRPHG